MKKLLLTLSTLVVALLSFAQAPNLFNYQGVARNAAGNVIPNQSVGLRLSILSGSSTGTAVYVESRTVVTNAFGLFNVQVGGAGATSTTGTIAGVNWSGIGGAATKFLQVEIDPTGGTNYVNVGSTQMLSVPYALTAAGAAPIGTAGGDLTGSYPNPTINTNAVTTPKIADGAVTTAKITFPVVKTQSDAGPLVGMTNSGAGDGIQGINTGTGRGGYFQVNNAASTADGLRGETNGTGASWAIRGISTGTNGAGLFVQSNAANTASNLQSNQAGLGRAGLFNSTNAAANTPGLESTVAGTGFAIRGISTNATPFALQTVGGVQLTGIGEGANKVLVSDATGNATWQPVGATGGVTGSGTLNFIPKWTPSGTVLGNSLLSDNGTSIGLGTVTPGARFDVTNASTTARGLLVNNTSATNISSTIVAQSSNITGAGTTEAAAMTALLSPFGAGTTVSTANTPVAFKAFAAPTTTIGFAGGTAIQGSSSSGIGILGIANDGTALNGFVTGTGYSLQTNGRIQIAGQGAALGSVLTSDAAGNATWQAPAPAPNVGIIANQLTTNISVPSNAWRTITEWGNLTEDGGANYNATTGQYTITTSGLYAINAQVVFTGYSNPTGFILIRVNKNGLGSINGYMAEGSGSATGGADVASPQLAIYQRFAAGDKITIDVYQTSPAAQSINAGYYANTMSIQLIRK